MVCYSGQDLKKKKSDILVIGGITDGLNNKLLVPCSRDLKHEYMIEHKQRLRPLDQINIKVGIWIATSSVFK